MSRGYPRIVAVEESEGFWSVVIEVEYKDRVYSVKAERLLRRPSSAEASLEGEYLVVRLSDDKGRGLATCHIHVSHLEKGCVDCKCLLKPAG